MDLENIKLSQMEKDKHHMASLSKQNKIKLRENRLVVPEVRDLRVDGRNG